MKKILGVALAALVLMTSTVSCSKTEVPAVQYLEVTAANIAGSWTLSTWNGSPLSEGCYVNVSFDRKEKTFEMYQNLDSFSERKLTGQFNILKDESYGSIIRGVYDYETGFWSHDYIIRDLTADSMVWIAVDDPDDVTVYVRVK
ncbi:MAG: hypothetical protein ACI395_01685 [Candidatus Cryptobacteroides sp.]